METRDKIFLLLLAGGAGYAGWANRDWIAERLGQRDLDPNRIKAIRLAKDSGCAGKGQTNWQHLQSRKRSGQIEYGSDLWMADPLQGNEYVVSATYYEEIDGDPSSVTSRFLVDIATTNVQHIGIDTAPAAPR